ncbi:kunitz-type serine protease inhibitor Bt-KTI-like [Calliopsis andreniformis]|uniref:kunitz-type serine protease inhibitor Bt-KTI-like n=1 Tax=Calliopsis andreniformis TaxID=337506 RepID=UPI003FCCCF2C
MNAKVVALFLAVLCCVLIYETSAAIGPQCLLPLERGPCRAMMLRYGYNPETGKCEEFIYGGCSGNENNFKSLAGCGETCS